MVESQSRGVLHEVLQEGRAHRFEQTFKLQLSSEEVDRIELTVNPVHAFVD